MTAIGLRVGASTVTWLSIVEPWSFSYVCRKDSWVNLCDPLQRPRQSAKAGELRPQRKDPGSRHPVRIRTPGRRDVLAPRREERLEGQPVSPQRLQQEGEGG